MKKSLVPILLVSTLWAFFPFVTGQSKGLAQAATPTTGRQPMCTNGQLGPLTITQRTPGGGADPHYGYYCGTDNRCPSADPKCQACDSVDQACQKHDTCWEQGACSGAKPCKYDEFAKLDARDRLPSWIGNLSQVEKDRLAQMRRCNVILCDDMRSVTILTADQNETRLMPQITFGGCNPPLVPVIGGDWNQASGGPQVHLVQIGDTVTGSYTGGPGHSGLVGTISGKFNGNTFVGEYMNHEGSISGKGMLTWTFSTTIKNGPNQDLSQDKLDGTYQGITFPEQHGPWVMTRD